LRRNPSSYTYSWVARDSLYPCGVYDCGFYGDVEGKQIFIGEITKPIFKDPFRHLGKGTARKPQATYERVTPTINGVRLPACGIRDDHGLTCAQCSPLRGRVTSPEFGPSKHRYLQNLVNPGRAGKVSLTNYGTRVLLSALGLVDGTDLVACRSSR